MVTHEDGGGHGHHQPPSGFIWKYIFSIDHKVIGIQYLCLALFSVFVGMGLSLLMRLHLAWPTTKWFFFKGGLMTPEQYLALMTMHGTIMVFMVLTTAPQSGFGNYFLPIQIGAADMAFPVLNMLSFWTTFVSLVVMIAAFFVAGGAPIGGWTSYPTLSALGEIAGPGQGAGETLWIVGLAIFCGASLMGALNFITTLIDLRAKGMTLGRLPLTCWTWFVTAILGLLAFGVLLAACILLLLDRIAGTSFFVPGGLVITDQVVTWHKGGSPLLWQHLFWFFGHPEVYLAILPGMGVTSHLLSTFSRRPVFGYTGMVYSTLAIGGLGFMVWGHHMFVSGMNPFAGIAFSALTLTIAVPSSVKTFNWLATLWRGRIHFTTPMLFAIGFVSLFITGGLTGPMLAQPKLDVYLHDTHFVVAHFHMIMGMAAVFGIFAATYFWFPKMFGRMMDERLGKVHFWFSFLGAYATFVPMHFLGLAGHPRRYSQLVGSATYLQQLLPMQRFITFAAIALMVGQLFFLVNLFWSMFRGKIANANPWQATTLEWAELPEGEKVTVHRGPYEFLEGEPGAPDFVMQSAARLSS